MATDFAGTESSTSKRRSVHILVAWNPTSSGHEAISYAAWLARSMPVKIRVISILLRPWPATSLAKLGGKYQKSFKKEAKACATAVEQALTAADVDPQHWDDKVSVLADGSSPAPILSEAAKDFDADLVIVGSSASTPKGRFHTSSTTSALLHSSPSPLGLAPRATKLSKHGITRLNYAFLESGEDTSQVGLLYAASLADRLSLPLRIVAFSPTGIVDIPVTIKKILGARSHRSMARKRPGDARPSTGSHHGLFPRYHRRNRNWVWRWLERCDRRTEVEERRSVVPRFQRCRTVATCIHRLADIRVFAAYPRSCRRLACWVPARGVHGTALS